MERWIEIGGFTCRYALSGTESEAPPVFFLSGAFQTMESWRKFARHFESKTRVLLADLPGMGSSALLPRRFGLDFLADAAARVMDAAGVRAAYVVSASYGSPVAYRLAQLHAERVDRLVLAGVMKEIPPELRAKTANTLATLAEGRLDQFANDVVDGLLCRDPEKQVDKRRLAERLLLGQLGKMPRAERARYIENTARLLNHAPLDLTRPPRCRTLVFTGEHDVYTRPAHCREIADALPDAWFALIERADHLFHLERFETTLALLDRFYAGKTLRDLDGCRAVEHITAWAKQPAA